MKKILLCLSLCLLLVGCGNKLTCTYTDDEYKEQIQIAFKGDEYAKLRYTEIDEDLEYIEDSCEEWKEEFEFSGVDIEVKCSDKKISFFGSAEDINKATDDFLFVGMTKEEVKEQLEENGYKCN